MKKIKSGWVCVHSQEEFKKKRKRKDRDIMVKGKSKNIYNRAWIIENSKSVLEEYTDGITLRQLYYRLVARGMINDFKHYQKVVSGMVKARWENIIDFDSFIDRERSMHGETKLKEKYLKEEIESAKFQIKAWMNSYRLNRWSNQPVYVEVWIEKKALQGVFEKPCEEMEVGLAPCKGYPSLSFLNEASDRFNTASNEGKTVKILYFGDYDPSGEDIPNSIENNLARMGYDVEVERIALTTEMIEEFNLPGVPPKATDSRTANWSGDRAVELDALEPDILKKMCKEAIEKYFDESLHDELREKESTEREEYKEALKEHVEELASDV